MLRLNDEFPGDRRQGKGGPRLPQRDLLRPRRIRGRPAAPILLRRQRPHEAHARPRRPCSPALPKSPTTLDLYLFAQKGRRGRLVVPPDSRQSCGATRCSRGWRLRSLDRAGRRPNCPGSWRSRSSWSATSRTASGRPLHLGGAPAAGGAPGAGAELETRRLSGHHLARLAGAASGGALGRGRCGPPEPSARRRSGCSSSSRSRPGPSMDPRAPRQGHPQRRARRARLPDRRCARLCRQRGICAQRPGQPWFEPKYDAAGDGARQPGSAFKPILYAAAFDAERLTPGSLLLDITTEFDRRQDWAPRDADQLDRGPVLVRRHCSTRSTSPRSARWSASATRRSPGGRDGRPVHRRPKAFLQAGLAGALGTVEVTPLDLTTAYATIANGGVRVAPRMVHRILDADGGGLVGAPPGGDRAISAEAAWLVTDILRATPTPRRTRSGPRSCGCATVRTASTDPPRPRRGRPTMPETWARTGSCRPSPVVAGLTVGLDGQQRPLVPPSRDRRHP